MPETLKPIELPQFPRGEFLEHLAFACYHCLGFYVEHNIVNREDGQEILELDALVTDFDTPIPSSRLVECKSGDYGFSDLFKIVGWLQYLNIDCGTLVASSPAAKDKDSIFRKRAKDLGIDLIILRSSDEAAEAFRSINNEVSIDEADLNAWRYSYWIEKRLLERLRHLKKSCVSVDRYQKLQSYYDQLNNSVFFTTNLIARVDDLYSTYKMYPKITARCSREMEGGKFSDDVDTISDSLFRRTFYSSENNDLQIACFIEQRARLAILQNAIEFKILEKEGVTDDRTSREARFLGFDFDRYEALPKTLRDGLDMVISHPYVRRYPRFWQWFHYVLGGFILLEKKEDEYRLIASKTGVPLDQIDNALSSYELLFPSERSWFEEIQQSSISRMIFNSGPFEGIGAYYRKLRYAKGGNYGDIGLSAHYAVNDLSRWNNLAYSILCG